MKVWNEKRQEDLHFAGTWKIKSFYATPRDQVTWLKLQHRTLYTVGHRTDMDNTCMACPEKENQEHLVECGVIREEFWDPILKLLTDMGMEVPHNVGNFLIAGHMRRRKVISNNYSGIVFLAWRCLYAQRSNTQERRAHPSPYSGPTHALYTWPCRVSTHTVKNGRHG